MKQYLELFTAFFKLGCFCFGGGYAAIPLIENEVVHHKKWLDKEKIIDIFAVAQALPGAVALNASAFVGYSTAGIPGAIAALVGILMPSVLIVFSLAALFVQYSSNEMIKRAFLGIRPVVVALIAYAAYKMGQTAIRDFLGIILALTAFGAALFIPSFPIPFMIIAGAVLGLILNRTVKKEVE